jgi:hypothetical protein
MGSSLRPVMAVMAVMAEMVATLPTDVKAE